MGEGAYKITVEGREGAFPCAAGDTLLGAALRAGLGLAHECASGGCGSCKVDLKAGDVDLAYPASPGLKPRDFDKGKRLACMTRPRSDLTIRFLEAEEARPVIRPRRQPARLLSRQAVTHDIFELRFALEGDDSFLPGQFALLDVPGLPAGRAYSMANLPGQCEWHFHVRRVPGGRASGFLLDTLAPGDALTLDGPYGTAFYRPGLERDVAVVAGGSGLAPMLSVARAALRDPGWRGRRLHFHYGARTGRDMIAPELLGFDDPRLVFHPVLSDVGEDEAWSGPRGLVHDHLRDSLGDDASTREFYLAGPPPMVEAVRRVLLLEQSIPVDQVHYDRFF
ncbi:2Fe-2S iron-sulfur cluster-binding protein [Xanthobacter variabilis]|uniref:2Fe-2S iron-sulfur cluster-binding protein n=1 Tax=Xanthobacter variabilis TaxID=3119932 RepID=UPI00374F0D31